MILSPWESVNEQLFTARGHHRRRRDRHGVRILPDAIGLAGDDRREGGPRQRLLHGNCGLICPSHVLPLAEPGMVGKGLAALFQKNSPLAIKFRMDPALWSWLVHFALRCNHRDMMEAGRGIQPLLESSLDLYRELIEREGLRVRVAAERDPVSSTG